MLRASRHQVCTPPRTRAATHLSQSLVCRATKITRPWRYRFVVLIAVLVFGRTLTCHVPGCQEMPENAPAGLLPRSIGVILEGELVDACKPGDRVRIIGVYRALPNSSMGETSGVFRSVIIGNNVACHCPPVLLQTFQEMCCLSRCTSSGGRRAPNVP